LPVFLFFAKQEGKEQMRAELVPPVAYVPDYGKRRVRGGARPKHARVDASGSIRRYICGE
jgi:hypothetical protein